MFGMTFSSFLTLLVIGAVCAFIVDNVVKLRVLNKAEGFLGEWIIGWIGAWIGSSVVGHWGWMVPDSSIYLGPAIISSLASVYMSVVLVKLAGSLLSPLLLRDASAFSDETTRVA